MKVAILSILYLIFFTISSFADNSLNSLSFGAISVKIGDDKTEVLQKLQTNYRLQKMKLYDSYFIIDNLNNNNIGSVQFDNNKLILVNKHWGSFSEYEGEKLLRTFLNAVSTLPDGKGFAQVYLHKIVNPGVTNEDLYLCFGQRTIVIGILELNDQKSLQISETLQVPNK